MNLLEIDTSQKKTNSFQNVNSSLETQLNEKTREVVNKSRSMGLQEKAEKALSERMLYIDQLEKESPLKVFLKNIGILNQKNKLSYFHSALDATTVVEEAFEALYLALKDSKKPNEELETLAYKAAYIHFLTILKKAAEKHPENQIINDLCLIQNNELSKTFRYKGSSKKDKILSFKEKVENSLWVIKNSALKTPYKDTLEQALKNVFSDCKKERFSEAFLHKDPKNPSIRELCFQKIGLKWKESASLFDQWEVKSDLNYFFMQALEHISGRSLESLLINRDFQTLDALAKEFDETGSIVEEQMGSLMNSFSVKVDALLGDVEGLKKGGYSPYDAYFESKMRFKALYEEVKNDISSELPEKSQAALQAYVNLDIESLFAIQRQDSYEKFSLQLEHLKEKPEAQPLFHLLQSLKDSDLDSKTKAIIHFLKENNQTYFSKPLRLLLKDQTALNEEDIQESKIESVISLIPEEVAKEIRPLFFKDQVIYLTKLLEEPNIDDCLAYLANGKDKTSSLAAYELVKQMIESENQDFCVPVAIVNLFFKSFLGLKYLDSRFDSLFSNFSNWLKAKNDSPLLRFLEENNILLEERLLGNQTYLKNMIDLRSHLDVFVLLLQKECTLLQEKYSFDLENLQELENISAQIGYKKCLFWLDKCLKNEKFKDDEDLLYLNGIKDDYNQVKDFFKEMSLDKPRHLQNLKIYFEAIFFSPSQSKMVEDAFLWNPLQNKDSVLSTFFREMEVLPNASSSLLENYANRRIFIESFVSFIKQTSKEEKNFFTELDEVLKGHDLLLIEQAFENLSLEKDILIHEFKKKIDKSFDWITQSSFLCSLGIFPKDWDKNISYYEKSNVLNNAFSIFYKMLNNKIHKTGFFLYISLLELALAAENVRALDWIFKEVSYHSYLQHIAKRNLASQKEFSVFIEDLSIDEKISKTTEFLQKNFSIYAQSGLEDLISFPDLSRQENPLSSPFLALLNKIDYISKHPTPNAYFINYLLGLKGKNRPTHLTELQLAIDYPSFILYSFDKCSLKNKKFLKAEFPPLDKVLSDLGLFNLDRIIVSIALSDEALSLDDLIRLHFFNAAIVYLKSSDQNLALFEEFLTALESICPHSKQLDFINLLAEKEMNCFINYALYKGNSDVKKAVFASLKESIPVNKSSRDLEEEIFSFFLKSHLDVRTNPFEISKIIETSELLIKEISAIIKNDKLSPFFMMLLRKGGLVGCNSSDLLISKNYQNGFLELLNVTSSFYSALDSSSNLVALKNPSFLEIDLMIQGFLDLKYPALSNSEFSENMEAVADAFLLNLLKDSFSYSSLKRQNSYLALFLKEMGVENSTYQPILIQIMESKRIVLSFIKKVFSYYKELQSKGLDPNFFYFDDLKDLDQEKLLNFYKNSTKDELAGFVDKVFVLNLQKTIQRFSSKDRRKLERDSIKFLKTAKQNNAFPDEVRSGLENILKKYNIDTEYQIDKNYLISGWAEWILAQPFKDQFLSKEYELAISFYEKDVLINQCLENFSMWLEEQINSLEMHPLYSDFLKLALAYSSFEQIRWIFLEVVYERYLKCLKDQEEAYPDLVSDLLKFNEDISQLYTENKIEKLGEYLEKNKDDFNFINKSIKESVCQLI